MSILTNFLGVSGGADFNNFIDYRFSIEGRVLSFRVPQSHVELGKNMPVNINVEDDSFVSKYIDEFGPAVYVPINDWRWNYRPNFLSNKLAGFSLLSLRIRKPKNSKKILTDEAMKEYLTSEYSDYYEDSERQGAKGFNRYQKLMALDYFKRRYGERKDFQEEMKEYLDGILMTVPQGDSFKVFKGFGNDWVYFFLENELNYPASHYCLRLDENNILEFVFSYFWDMNKWKNDILKVKEDLEQRIMDTVTVDFHDALTVNDTSSGLLNP